MKSSVTFDTSLIWEDQYKEVRQRALNIAKNQGFDVQMTPADDSKIVEFAGPREALESIIWEILGPSCGDDEPKPATCNATCFCKAHKQIEA